MNDISNKNDTKNKCIKNKDKIIFIGILIFKKSFNKYGNINKINALKFKEVLPNLMSQRKRKLKKDKKSNI